jgi:hypothetical protein
MLSQATITVSKLATLCLAVASVVSPVSAAPFTHRAVSEKRQVQGAACTDVHIFLAKGWNEPYPGRQGKLSGATCSGLESCDYEDILYYNAPDADYCASVFEGNTNGVAQMTAYAERCPDSRLVLSGYSQGANVAGDILGGGGGVFGNSTVNCTVGDTPGLDRTTSPGNKRKFLFLSVFPLSVSQEKGHQSHSARLYPPLSHYNSTSQGQN